MTEYATKKHLKSACVSRQKDNYKGQPWGKEKWMTKKEYEKKKD